MDALAPEDIARTITFVVTQPQRVDINEVLIRPLDQVQPYRRIVRVRRILPSRSDDRQLLPSWLAQIHS
nr:hypothetical protein [Haloarcula mannanilytica]